MENEKQILNAKPDLDVLARLDGPITHISAKGEKFGCVLRSFAPKPGAKEDPVCQPLTLPHRVFLGEAAGQK